MKRIMVCSACMVIALTASAAWAESYAIDVGDGAWDDAGEDNANGLQVATNASTFFAKISTGADYTERRVSRNSVTFISNTGGVAIVRAWADYSCIIDNDTGRYSGPVPWRLEGLAAGAYYNLVFLSTSAAQAGKFTVAGVGDATPDADGDGNFETVEADGTGVIEGTWDVWSSNVWSTFTALQIERAPPPGAGTVFTFR